jgi:hypothetical protein
VLPWTQPDPERKSSGKFNCGDCWGKTARAVIEHMHCGYLPRERWTAWTPERRGLPKVIGADPYEVDVCPGFLVRQQAVIDGASAYSALEAGNLARFDPENLRIVNQAALCAQRAFNLYQLERQKVLSPRAGRP